MHSFGSLAEAKVYCYAAGVGPAPRMTPEEIKVDQEGMAQPCVLLWPFSAQEVEEPRVLALPLRRRLGGFLLALPAS